MASVIRRKGARIGKAVSGGNSIYPFTVTRIAMVYKNLVINNNIIQAFFQNN